MKKLRALDNLTKDITYSIMDSPVGELTIITSPEGLHAILWEDYGNNTYYKQILANFTQNDQEKYIVQVKQQLNEYFKGKRHDFTVKLVLQGTDFQIQAWNELIKIPYATTLSYAEQALRIGDKKKARAMGMANGLNPIPIIIPCHRVIGSNGNLTGFGGGIDKKKLLLTLEKSNL